MVQGRHGTREFRGSSGLLLVADVFGPREGPIVLFAHGGGQTRHAWGGAAEQLGARGYHALTIDLRGHGESQWCPEGNYAMDAFARDLITVAQALARPPHLVGASLGGMSGLLAEGTLAPGVFASLTLVDITPQLTADGVARIVGFMGANVDEGFGSLEEAAEAIARYLPHRKRPRDLAGLAKNLRQHRDGRYRWHWDPRFLASRAEGGPRHDPGALEAAARGLGCPVHLVRGRMSELVTEEAVAAFLADVPHAAYSDITGAGHMVAGDRNDAFAEAVLAFLERIEPVAGR